MLVASVDRGGPHLAEDDVPGFGIPVFRSWDNPRAIYYRRMNDIPSDWGTAVNVQSMVFGNTGDTSGTGVAFTRNPATGEKKLFGEFLMNAQGEDVVAGVRTPQTIDQLAEVMPEVYKQFTDICAKLEYHYRDMQDMEFTIEDKKLYMLQTRNGKRTAAAAMKIACDLVDEGMITEEEAVAMIDPKSLDSLLHPTFDPAALKKAKVVGTGLAASPGAACGQIVFSAEKATDWAKNGHKVVLVRLETSPEDIEGMHYAQGVLTVRGGMTSHAAVVARGMGTCCVSGCGAIKMNEEARTFELSGKTYKEGDWISIDGSTGNIYGEKIKTAAATISGDFDRLMSWADKFRRLQVRTNADTPHDARQAAAFGAEGIGLCRTEHMFFEADRIKAMREMIVSETSEQRERALAKLEPIQQADFEAIYEAMKGRPVTIRLLDPPLHEFVPTDPKDIEELAKEMNLSVEHLNQVISSLHEFNPMMGHRGCRLDVTFPEIAKMQTAAIIKAALAVRSRRPAWKITPEIMVPLVGEARELAYVKSVIDQVAKKIIKAAGSDMAVLVKMNMRDGFRGGMEIDETMQVAKRLECSGAHGLVLSGGFVSKAPMYVMRGEMPIRSMTHYMTCWWLKYGVRLVGKWMIPSVPFREAYFLDDALKFRKALDMPLVYVGGLVTRRKIDEVLNDGFEAVQMGRALLNEPGFVNRMRMEENARCSCKHSNYCIARMYTVDMACHQHLQEELPDCLKKEIERIESRG